jgi:DNA-directed RNA polymerase specialized sigma24 family protein
MDVNKELLKESFLKKDFNTFFKEARTIADFVAVRKFGIFNDEERHDINQECLENLWIKITANKVDSTKDLFAFIWKNSEFKIMEIKRKENRREKIAPMYSYDEEDAEWMKMFSGYKYNPENIVLEKEFAEENKILLDTLPKKQRKKRTKKIEVA